MLPNLKKILNATISLKTKKNACQIFKIKLNYVEFWKSFKTLPNLGNPIKCYKKFKIQQNYVFILKLC